MSTPGAGAQPGVLPHYCTRRLYRLCRKVNRVEALAVLLKLHFYSIW